MLAADPRIRQMRSILTMVGDMETIVTDDEDSDIYVDSLMTEYLTMWANIYQEVLDD